MMNIERELRTTNLRRETERALEEGLRTGIDPRLEYHRLVWVLRRRFIVKNVPAGRGTAPSK